MKRKALSLLAPLHGVYVDHFLFDVYFHCTPPSLCRFVLLLIVRSEGLQKGMWVVCVVCSGWEYGRVARSCNSDLIAPVHHGIRLGRRNDSE